MNKSFTLIEILIVIVVIGSLSAFVLVGMSSITESANITKGKAFADSLRNLLLTSLVSEWKLDGNANDSWGVNNGTLVGPTHLPVLKTGPDCVLGSCYQFDGTEDYVSIINNNNLSFGSDNFSINLWMKQNVYNFLGGIIWHGNPEGASGFYFRANSMDTMQFLVRNGATYANIVKTIGSGNKWNNITIQLKNNYLEMYSNGIDLGGHVSIANPNSTTSSDMFIGRDPLALRYFNGLIDSVQIYSQALSTSQIEQNYFIGLNSLYNNGKLTRVEYSQRLTQLKYNLSSNE